MASVLMNLRVYKFVIKHKRRTIFQELLSRSALFQRISLKRKGSLFEIAFDWSFRKVSCNSWSYFGKVTFLYKSISTAEEKLKKSIQLGSLSGHLDQIDWSSSLNFHKWKSFDYQDSWFKRQKEKVKWKFSFCAIKLISLNDSTAQAVRTSKDLLKFEALKAGQLIGSDSN